MNGHNFCVEFIQWDVLRDLVPFLHFKKLEKHPWRSGTFSKKSVTFSKSIIKSVTFS